jgi:ectoine hydroxylase-related dioxygenase (phytanoyl-CoA dioxygenase family)
MLKKSGYKIFRNYINKNSINNMAIAFSTICKFVQPKLFNIKKCEQFQNKNLCKVLINLRKRKKNNFSQIYDLMQYSDAVKKFCYENNLDSVARKILRCRSEDLYLRTQFRIDVPYDERNTFDWHQDSAYDKLNNNPKNGLIFWIPLVHTNEQNGTLILKPKSHNEKNNYFTKVKFGLRYKSPQLVVQKSKIEKYVSLQPSCKVGDCILTYANLFHKSGYNSSDRIRFTIIARYNKITTKDFFIFKKNK